MALIQAESISFPAQVETNTMHQSLIAEFLLLISTLQFWLGDSALTRGKVIEWFGRSDYNMHNKFWTKKMLKMAFIPLFRLLEMWLPKG